VRWGGRRESWPGCERRDRRGAAGVNVLVVVLTLGLLGLVVLLVSAPLRAAAGRERDGTVGEDEDQLAATGAEQEQELRQRLEAEREAKYREIRDAELDFRTGKLSREDYEAIDAALRAEAIGILDRLQAAQERPD
jgi:hypothetical protein